MNDICVNPVVALLSGWILTSMSFDSPGRSRTPVDGLTPAPEG